MNLEQLIREIGELGIKNGRLNSDVQSTPRFHSTNRQGCTLGKTKFPTKSSSRLSKAISSTHFNGDVSIDNRSTVSFAPSIPFRFCVTTVTEPASVPIFETAITIIIKNSSSEQMQRIDTLRIIAPMKNKEPERNFPEKNSITNSVSAKGFPIYGALPISIFTKPSEPKPTASNIRDMTRNRSILVHLRPKKSDLSRSEIHKKTLWRASAQRALRASAQILKSQCVSSQTASETSTKTH